ncbi:hypothetical protein [Oryzomonas rubra]|uniref:Uncharacterized protein n=1 Tax=Oryzomonas rubra TaxID=2509454 RepID=A0A5A9X4I8_9BACT|nr:hypothetical protein [Oryzomonas rubra]KAA0888062.1 hypothetical protein ET418_16820 [Oryzomonas rubra]
MAKDITKTEKRGRPAIIKETAPSVVHIRVSDEMYSKLVGAQKKGLCKNTSDLIRDFINEGILRLELRHGSLTNEKLPPAISENRELLAIVDTLHITMTYFNDSRAGFVARELSEVQTIIQEAQMSAPEFVSLNLQQALTKLEKLAKDNVKVPIISERIQPLILSLRQYIPSH